MEEVIGQSGRRYVIERVLQDKGIQLGRVYLASYVFLALKCSQSDAYPIFANPAMATQRLC